MSKLLYSEEQNYSTPWIWLVIFPAIGTLVFLLKFDEIGSDFTSPEGKDDILGFIILAGVMFVLMLGLTLLFYKMKLITQIRSNGIYFRYFPFMKKERLIAKVEISKYEVRIFKPGKEFGGHGVRKGKGISGKSYTVSGRLGLQLHLTNGHKILIGTKRKEAIQYAIDKMMNKD